MSAVKNIIEQIIDKFPNNSTITVEQIIEISNGEIDRIDIVNVFSCMEEEELGVFWRGRRGKQSRFVKGARRVSPAVNKVQLDNLREYIKTKVEKGNAVLVSYEDCFEKAGDDPDLASELEQYKDHVDGAWFFGGKISKAVDALKILQEEGLGTFVIGRRGKFSRFIYGVSKEELKAKPKGMILSNDIENVEKPVSINVEYENPGYNIVRGLILPAKFSGNYKTLGEVIEAANISVDIEEVAEQIKKNNYYPIDAGEENVQ